MSLGLNFLMKAWVQLEAGLYLEVNHSFYVCVKTLGHCLFELTEDLTRTDASEAGVVHHRFGLLVGKQSERVQTLLVTEAKRSGLGLISVIVLLTPSSRAFFSFQGLVWGEGGLALIDRGVNRERWRLFFNIISASVRDNTVDVGESDTN